MALKTYSCLNCNAELKWDPKAGCFRCEYCDSEFQEADLDTEVKAEVKEEPVVSTDAKTGEKIVTYTCSYCGAEVVTTEDTAASFCVYCQRPMVMENNLKGEFQPKFVIPFSKTQKEAKAAFQEFIKGKIFLPDAYIQDQNIEKISGIYVPFWIFDTEMSFDTTLNGEIVHHRSDSDYNYTITKHYQLIRQGEFQVEGVPADGSSKIDDFTMAAIEPFDWTELREFNTPYLSGFLAERYDVDADTAFENCIIKKLNTSLDDKIMGTCSGYSSVYFKTNERQVDSKTGQYAMLPVWMLYSQFEGKSYVFAMNGQTGKLRGNLPIDKKKVAFYAAKIMGIATVALGALATGLWYMGVL